MNNSRGLLETFIIASILCFAIASCKSEETASDDTGMESAADVMDEAAAESSADAAMETSNDEDDDIECADGVVYPDEHPCWVPPR